MDIVHGTVVIGVRAPPMFIYTRTRIGQWLPCGQLVSD